MPDRPKAPPRPPGTSTSRPLHDRHRTTANRSRASAPRLKQASDTKIRPPQPETRDNPIERRRAPRLPITAYVRVKHAKHTFSMNAINASVGGLLIEDTDRAKPRWVREGQRVELQLVLEDGPDLNFSATIVRVEAGNEVEPTRFGVEFAPPEPEAAALLRAILDAASEGEG